MFVKIIRDCRIAQPCGEPSLEFKEGDKVEVNQYNYEVLMRESFAMDIKIVEKEIEEKEEETKKETKKTKSKKG